MDTFDNAPGDEAIAGLASLVAGSSEPEIGRILAAIALSRRGRDTESRSAHAALSKLLERDPGLRRVAIAALASIGGKGVEQQIAAHLNDHQEDPQAWEIDDCTVAHAAKAALEKIAALMVIEPPNSALVPSPPSRRGGTPTR